MSFIPAEVRRYIDLLEGHGLEYEIVYDLPRKITLITRTDRVYADATFKQQGHRWRNAKPKLLIDGQPCEYAHSFAELKAIISDPDLHLATQRLREQFPQGFSYEPNPPHPEHGVDVCDPRLPDKVRSYRLKLAPILAGYPTAMVRFENPHVDLWQIRLSNIDPGSPVDFVVMFGPKHGTWEVRAVMLVLTPGDENLGLDLGLDLERALGSYVGLEDKPTSVGPVARARSLPRTKNDALVVKSNTVIRT